MKRSFARPSKTTQSPEKAFSLIAPQKTVPLRSPTPRSSKSREILEKLSRLALLYAAEEQENLPIARLYRERILSGEVQAPLNTSIAEERWVLHLGFRRLDEAWIDAETHRLMRR
jgi:hypothetical protein